MTAQGPELRALADTLRELRRRVEKQRYRADDFGHSYVMLDMPTADDLISALKRAAAAEGEKAEGRYPTPRADSMSSSVQPMADPYRSAS